MTQRLQDRSSPKIANGHSDGCQTQLHGNHMTIENDSSSSLLQTPRQDEEVPHQLAPLLLPVPPPRCQRFMMYQSNVPVTNKNNISNSLDSKLQTAPPMPNCADLGVFLLEAKASSHTTSTTSTVTTTTTNQSQVMPNLRPRSTSPTMGNYYFVNERCHPTIQSSTSAPDLRNNDSDWIQQHAIGARTPPCGYSNIVVSPAARDAFGLDQTQQPQPKQSEAGHGLPTGNGPIVVDILDRYLRDDTASAEQHIPMLDRIRTIHETQIDDDCCALTPPLLPSLQSSQDSYQPIRLKMKSSTRSFWELWADSCLP